MGVSGMGICVGGVRTVGACRGSVSAGCVKSSGC